MPLTLSTRHSGNVCIVECAGAIVLGQEERALDAALDHVEREFHRILLNLSAIIQLDSMGLGLLVRHATRLARHGGAICLVASPPSILSLLELTQLSSILPNFKTENDALRSLSTAGAALPPHIKIGARLLVFDPSADLCTFVRSVLSARGFDVRTTCAFGDARLLLRVDHMDYILVGPGTPQLPGEIAARDLAALAPRASVLRLDADFKSRDALAATVALLEIFGLAGASPLSA
jgi:anti-sigma B factor antagonist